MPAAGEYVADGAARQAAWVLSGAGAAPAWAPDAGQAGRAAATERYEAAPQPAARARYAQARDEAALPALLRG